MEIRGGSAPENELFGTDRILEVVRSHIDKTAQEIVDALYRRADRFSKHAHQQDDMTAVIVKVPNRPRK